MTKAEEKILQMVRKANEYNCLCGLGTSPGEYMTHEHRFVRRLHEKGLIVWVEASKKYGKAWALAENAHKFTE